MNGKLILFPVPIGADDVDYSLPRHNKELLDTCHTFVVEELRTARRFLKHVGYAHSIDSTTFFLLNEHSSPTDIANYLDPIVCGENVGLLSEAGLPCVADPGRLITSLAQQRGVEIVPLVGPSSLMLALMASGFNGQNFAFVGYLPIDKAQRVKTVKNLEQRLHTEHQTQIFIEAPYRNNQLLGFLATHCAPHTRICVACDLTLPSQQILTRTASQWAASHTLIDLHKRNTVFLLGE